ncbi:MAG: glycosyltransferase family 4 protein, partial [Hyphomicrobiales bacterium]|nr:glycosyltransferase family 4 protein [Hyphomicrobiales bacterium]
MVGKFTASDIGNYIALDEPGGLQVLYAAVAAHWRREGYHFHTINRAERPVSEHLTELDNATVFSPVTEDRRSRRIAIRSYVKDRKIRRLVAWNYLLPPSLQKVVQSSVLYDHGMSSIRVATPENKARMAEASSVITVSSACKRLLTELWDVRVPIHVLPNPLRFSAASEHTTTDRRLGKEGVKLGCAGRLVSFKGLHSVVHAVAELKRRGLAVQLKFAGEGEEETSLRAVASELGLRTEIEFAGQVTDMGPFFRDIDIFICPSLREPFGMVAAEALAFACPTIVSNVDGLPEAIPFPEAAVVLDPTLTLDEYASLGGSMDRMPALVYHPGDDRIAPPKALDPMAIADAVERMVHTYGDC